MEILLKFCKVVAISAFTNESEIFEKLVRIFLISPLLFSMFCDIMDQITDDYTALYINNTLQSNNLEDCIFWYKGKIPPANWRFGSKDFWQFHNKRYDKSYKDPF